MNNPIVAEQLTLSVPEALDKSKIPPKRMDDSSLALLNPMLVRDGLIQESEENGGVEGINDHNDPENLLQQDDILSQYLDNADARLTWRFTLVLALGTAIDAVEVLCLGFILGDLPDVPDSKKELLSSAVFVGMLLGGIFGGAMADRYGRRKLLVLCLILNAFAACASPFSPDIDWLIGFRVFGGIGIGGSIPILFSLASELLPSGTRGKMLSVIASFWMVGSLYTAIVGWIVLGKDAQNNRIYTGEYNNWRGFALMCAIPILITVTLMALYVPESPRFLWTKNRLTEIPDNLLLITGKAPTISELLAAKNQEIGRISFFQRAVMKGVESGSQKRQQQQQQQQQNEEPEKDTFERMRPPRDRSTSASKSEVRDAQSSGSNNSMQISDTQMIENSETPDEKGFIENFKLLLSAEIRRNFLVLCLIWFLLCFGTYGLATWITVLFEKAGLANPYLDTLIYTIANLPGNLATYWYLDIIGRRWMLFVGMILCAISVVLISCDTSNSNCIVICAFLFNFFSTAGWNALDVLTAESFPTKMRNTAMGSCTAFGRLGAIAAQFVFGSLIDDIPALLSVTFVLLTIGGLASLLLPQDTTGVKLVD